MDAAGGPALPEDEVASGDGTLAENLSGRSADRVLVAELLRGNQAAFRGLVQQHWAGFLRVAQLHVSTHAVAEEVVQETWIAVIKGLARFEGRSSLKTWMYRILVNIARTRGEREQRTVPFSSVGGAMLSDNIGGEEPVVDPSRFRRHDALFNGHWADAPSAFENLPEERVVSRETTAVIQEAIAQLPANQQSVVWLRDVEGWTSIEVCEALSLSEANQRVLLHRARSKVRAVLEGYLAGGSVGVA